MTKLLHTNQALATIKNFRLKNAFNRITQATTLISIEIQLATAEYVACWSELMIAVETFMKSNAVIKTFEIDSTRNIVNAKKVSVNFFRLCFLMRIDKIIPKIQIGRTSKVGVA